MLTERFGMNDTARLGKSLVMSAPVSLCALIN